MSIIVVANPKGGVGKTTVSTHIAGYFAACGHATMLGDVDRQQSSKLWLGLREANKNARSISTWDVNHDRIGRPPKGVTHIVLDSPAGLSGWRFKEVLALADKVIVPLQASVFDIFATRAFLDELQAHLATQKRARPLPIGLVGMRVDERTIAYEKLIEFVNTLDTPMVGHMRNTQNYVHLAASGLTMFDVAPGRVEKDLTQWQPICQWLDT